MLLLLPLSCKSAVAAVGSMGKRAKRGASWLIAFVFVALYVVYAEPRHCLVVVVCKVLSPCRLLSL
jgi:hypothetical protein